MQFVFKTIKRFSSQFTHQSPKLCIHKSAIFHIIQTIQILWRKCNYSILGLQNNSSCKFYLHCRMVLNKSARKGTNTPSI